jgi:hypothetical protein
VVGLPPVRSHELLEALVTTWPFDHDAAVPRDPDDGPDDQRLTGERPEPIPDRRLERVAELVASGPPLDVAQLVAIDSTQHNPVGAAAAASPTAERDGGDRGAARLELLPNRLAAQELVSAGPQPRLVDARCLASGRGAARLTREGVARAARTGAPPARDVQRCRRSCLAQVVDPAACARRDPAGRTPLLEPERSLIRWRRLARSPANRSRSGQGASGGPGGPPPPARRGPVSALEIRETGGGVQRVHSASTRSRTTANRAPRSHSPYCGCLQGFSAHPRAFVNARETLTLPW